MSKTYEARTVDLFGPQLLIESGGAVGVAGQCVWKLSSINESGIRYVQGLYQSGLSKIYAEGPLQVEGGKKAQSSEGVSIMNIAHNGDYNISASNGWARIKAQNIVLEADDQLHLLGNDIKIGYEILDKTQKITLSATEIDAGAPRGGNIADLLKTSNVFKAMAGSYVPGGRLISAGANIAKGFFG